LRPRIPNDVSATRPRLPVADSSCFEWAAPPDASTAAVNTRLGRDARRAPPARTQARSRKADVFTPARESASVPPQSVRAPPRSGPCAPAVGSQASVRRAPCLLEPATTGGQRLVAPAKIAGRRRGRARFYLPRQLRDLATGAGCAARSGNRSWPARRRRALRVRATGLHGRGVESGELAAAAIVAQRGCAAPGWDCGHEACAGVPECFSFLCSAACIPSNDSFTMAPQPDVGEGAGPLPVRPGRAFYLPVPESPR